MINHERNHMTKDIDPRLLEINERFRQAQIREYAAIRRMQDGDPDARADMKAALQDAEAARAELQALIESGACGAFHP